MQQPAIWAATTLSRKRPATLSPGRSFLTLTPKSQAVAYKTSLNNSFLSTTSEPVIRQLHLRQKEHVVIKPSTALSLRQAGITIPSCFSYYDVDGDLQVLPTAKYGLTFVAPAYTATELMDILPGGLDSTKTPGSYVKTDGITQRKPN